VFIGTSMTDNSSGVASLPAAAAAAAAAASLGNEELPDPDDDYPDLAESGASSNDPTNFAKPTKDGLKKGESDVPQYILGTLVVRVVAATDLEVSAGRSKVECEQNVFCLPHCLYAF
jgi:hypothetical protein